MSTGAQVADSNSTNAACIVTDKPFLTHLDKNLSSTFVNVTLLYAPTISLQSAIADRSKSTGSFLVAKRAHFCGPPTATTPFSRSTHELSGGFIVFIGSIAAHISTTVQHMLAHAASEAAVRRLIKPSVMELAHHGTCVNSLSPGYTMADMMTDMMRGLQVRQPEPVKRGDAVRADGVFRRAESGHIVDVQRGWAMAHRAGYAD